MPKTPRASRRRQVQADGLNSAPQSPGPEPFLDLVTQLRAPVEAHLKELLGVELERAKSRSPDVAAMVKAFRDMTLRGGKRFRAGLLVVGYRTVSTEGALEPAIEAAAALELLQSYLLIHDDWMDQDTSRRGGASAHVQLAEHFDSPHQGAAAAILAGDYGAALASRVLAGVRVDPARGIAALRCFSAMQMDVVCGQQLDIAARSQDVEEVYALKTSSYSVRGPLCLGALLAGGGETILTALDGFALPVGIAFQHRDDLLGLFGDASATGKPVGRDLQQGKRTLLTQLARQRLRGSARDTFHQVFGNAKATRGQLQRGLAVLRDSGLIEKVTERIAVLEREALSALQTSALPLRSQVLLASAASALLARDR